MGRITAEQSFITFVRQVLHAMEVRAADPDVARQIGLFRVAQLVRNPHGYWAVVEKEVKDYTSLRLCEYSPPLHELSSASECIQGMVNIDVLALQNGELLSDALPRLVAEMLYGIVHLLNTSRGRAFRASDGQILRIFHLFCNEWNRPQQWTVFAPVICLETSSQNLLLKDGWSLKRMSDGEVNSLWSPGFDSALGESVTSIGFRLCKRFIQYKPEDNQSLINELDRILLAIRLLKSGWISIPHAYFRTSAKLGMFGNYGIIDRRLVGMTYHRNLELRPSEVRKLNRLISQIASNQDTHLAVGLRRFNQVFTRDLVEDRIIDLTIALESTLLAGIQQELSYRIALRGAVLLEGLRPPEETQDIIQALYVIRSKVVHEGKLFSEQTVRKVVPKSIQPDEFPTICEGIVRDVLTAYLKQGAINKGVEDTNEDIESRLVTR